MFAKQTNDQLLISLVVLSAKMHQIFHRNFVHSDELVNKNKKCFRTFFPKRILNYRFIIHLAKSFSQFKKSCLTFIPVYLTFIDFVFGCFKDFYSVPLFLIAAATVIIRCLKCG